MNAIIPVPASVHACEGTLRLAGRVTIAVPAGRSDLRAAAELFVQSAQPLTQIALRVTSSDGARGITVVPEIEMPGHSAAILKAMPELSRDPSAEDAVQPNPSRFPVPHRCAPRSFATTVRWDGPEGEEEIAGFVYELQHLFLERPAAGP